jgi:hypothetical protein
MTRHVGQLTVTAVLLVAAGVSWTAAGRVRQSAAVTLLRVTLQEQSEYWSGNYDAVTSVTSDDPDALLTAANAVFRKAQRDSRPAPAVEQLDRALQAYASVLRNAPSTSQQRDAAYNFEYVARLRDAVAQPTRRVARPTPPSAAPPDDLPTGPTIHGQPGTHPPDTRGEQFDVLTPMDYGEREAQPEPTPGRRVPRKG